MYVLIHILLIGMTFPVFSDGGRSKEYPAPAGPGGQTAAEGQSLQESC